MGGWSGESLGFLDYVFPLVGRWGENNIFVVFIKCLGEILVLISVKRRGEKN